MEWASVLTFPNVDTGKAAVLLRTVEDATTGVVLAGTDATGSSSSASVEGLEATVAGFGGLFTAIFAAVTAGFFTFVTTSCFGPSAGGAGSFV